MLLCGAAGASAQRYLPGQTGIEITAGVADGFEFDRRDGQAFYGNLSISTYNNKGNRWVFGGEYFQRLYDYRTELIPVSQITVEGGHYFKLLSDPGKNVFLSFGLSGLAGYESLNWGKRMLFDGATIRGKDSFIYGGAASVELETFISDRIVFLIRARERVVWETSIKQHHFLQKPLQTNLPGIL